MSITLLGVTYVSEPSLSAGQGSSEKRVVLDSVLRYPDSGETESLYFNLLEGKGK